MELLSKSEIAREKNFSLRDNRQAYRMLLMCVWLSIYGPHTKPKEKA